LRSSISISPERAAERPSASNVGPLTADLLGREVRARDVHARMRREGEPAHLARDARRDAAVPRVGVDGDADGAAVLHRGADVDLHVRGDAAGVEVAPAVEDRAVGARGEVGGRAVVPDLVLLVVVRDRGLAAPAARDRWVVAAAGGSRSTGAGRT